MALPKSEKVLLAGLAFVGGLFAMRLAAPEPEFVPVDASTVVVAPSPSDEVVPPSPSVSYDGVTFYPVCEVEDCSDQPGQVGVWINEAGQHWLSLGEYSVLVE